MRDYEYRSIWTILAIKLGKSLGKLFVFLFKLSIEGYKSTYSILKKVYIERKK